MGIDAVLDRGFKELGIYEALQRLPVGADGQVLPYEERCRRWDEFKATTKKRFRALARELHPDANMDATEDDRRERQARLQSLTRAVDELENIKPRAPEPPPPPMSFGPGVIIIGVDFSAAVGGGSNTTATSYQTWPFRRG